MRFNTHMDYDTFINVIKTIPACLFFKDTDCKYVFSTKYWGQIKLGEDEEIYGKTEWDIRRDDANPAQIERMDREIIASGEGRQYTLKSVVEDRVFYLDIMKEPVFDADGKILGIVGLVNDVTRATESIAVMLDNEKEYQEAMRAGSFLAYNVNLSKDILRDDFCITIDGITRNLLEPMGMQVPCSYKIAMEKLADFMMEPEFRGEFIDYHSAENLISRFRNGERELNQESYMVVKGDNDSDKEIWMYETILLMKNRDGDILAFVTLKDITENRFREREMKRKLEKAVEDATKANEEAVRANKAKDMFLANTSHEIRTPMNAVVGLVEVLLREETDPKKIKYLNTIKDSGNHLLGIINDILDFSKVESGKLEINPDIYEPGKRFFGLETLLNERIGDKNIVLQFDIDEKIPQYLYGDSARLRQVMINLVNNAIKFTEKGKITLSVKVVSQTDTEIMEYISVEDTGIGIREKDKEKLFGAFNRLDKEKTAHIEGTGLGLALSKQLVELMGGKLEFESTYGVGTKFFFTIKQGKVNEAQVEAQRRKERKQYSEGRLFRAPKAKILVADDTPVNILVLKALLAPMEAHIDVAENGLEAYDLVREKDYDLVLMDHMMPIMDGMDATKAIRSMDSAKRNIPIVALSANAFEEVKAQLIAAGMNDFVTKPIQMHELMRVLRQYIPEEYIEE